MKEISLGTIGSGMIVPRILEGIPQIEGIRLSAVYSRSQGKATWLSSKFAQAGTAAVVPDYQYAWPPLGYAAEMAEPENTPEELTAKGFRPVTTYTDMDAFLADPDVNFVYIATPNLLHYEQAKRALLAGKNVFLEKPFTTRADQAEELIDIAEEKDLILVEMAPTSFLPNYEILLRELPKIGRVRLVMSNYSQFTPFYEKLQEGELPNAFNPRLAGGSLMDLNYYNVYLNIALFGMPDSCTYFANRYPLTSAAQQEALGDLAGRTDFIDASGVFYMQYPDFISMSFGAKDTFGDNFFQIEGEKGYITLGNGGNGLTDIRVKTQGSDETFNEMDHPHPFSNRWYYEMETLTRMILAGEKQAFKDRLEITLNTVRAMESARKAAGLYFDGDQ